MLPGDTVWLRRGTYRYEPESRNRDRDEFVPRGRGYLVKLLGTEALPVHVRAFPGERVTIDGGLFVQPPSTHLWIWDLEILVSDPLPPPTDNVDAVKRPLGGLSISGGSHCKFINLVVHNNTQGVTWQAYSATDSEFHGCLIYDNGFQGITRGHGHGIYAQNETGLKTISDCIFTGGYGLSIHCYGEKGHVNNFLVEGNICYKSGSVRIGTKLPMENIRVFNNYLYGVGMRIGSDPGISIDLGAEKHLNAEVRNNIVVNRNLFVLGFQQLVNEGNLIVQEEGPRPPGSKVILRPNKYDPNRANLAIFNWQQQPTVLVDASGFLKVGDRYRLMNPRDFFGTPVLADTYRRAPLSVPVAGEFAAFVLLREGAGEPITP